MEELWNWSMAYFEEKKRELEKIKDLRDWKLDWNRKKRCLGICNYKTKTIFLSKYLLEKALKEKEPERTEIIKKTLLHEFAHAIAGEDHGHDKVWKEIVVRIGGVPERCGASMDAPSKWSLSCPNNCIAPIPYHRKPSSQFTCNKCKSLTILKQNY